MEWIRTVFRSQTQIDPPRPPTAEEQSIMVEIAEREKQELSSRGENYDNLGIPGDFSDFDNEGYILERTLAPVLWFANAIPLSVLEFLKIALWVVIGGLLALEIYFLGQFVLS